MTSFIYEFYMSQLEMQVFKEESKLWMKISNEISFLCQISDVFSVLASYRPEVLFKDGISNKYVFSQDIKFNLTTFTLNCK